MEEILLNLSVFLENNLYLAPIIVFIAGAIASLSPCSFGQIPIFLLSLNNKNNSNDSRANRLIYAICFCIGNTITFTILGIIAAYFGKTIKVFGSVTYLIFAVLLIIIAFYILNYTNEKCRINKRNPKIKGKLGAFIYGLVGGLFASSCSTPVLIAILSFIVTTSNLLLGTIMLLFYGLGHSIIFILISVFYEKLELINSSSKFIKLQKVFKYIFVVLIIVLALYFFYLAF